MFNKILISSCLAASLLSGCAYINPSILKDTAPDPSWQSSDLTDALAYAKRTKTQFEKQSARFRDYNSVSATLIKGGAYGGSGVAIFDGPADALKGIAFGAAGIISGEDTVRSKQRYESFNKGILAIECGVTLANDLAKSNSDVSQAFRGSSVRARLNQMNLDVENSLQFDINNKQNDLFSFVESQDVNAIVNSRIAVQKSLKQQAVSMAAMNRLQVSFTKAVDASKALPSPTLWGIVSDVRAAIEKQIVADVVDLSKVTNDMAERLRKIREEIIAKYKAAAEEGDNTGDNNASLVAALAANEAKSLEESVKNCENLVSSN